LTVYGEGAGAALNLTNMGLGNGIHRTPDPLLYALAKYLYSLKPPINPNHNEAAALEGAKVFKKAGCIKCHVPPLYTNNRIMPVDGFHTAHDNKLSEAMNFSVGTDPNLALKTRKGTGFYRVPSLRMLWLYDCFLHDGSVGSLDELFDAARLKNNFHSSNLPASVPSQAVPGHVYGLELSVEDRNRLVAFLKTL